ITKLRERDLPANEMPIQAPYLLDDCAWVANRWCELLTMPLELKQRLMELDNPLVRLELVSDMLERNGIIS
ncbi:MAG TPA: peptidase S16, partial [Burkholderiaceae bacterium]|nr:peptidase S16 [Burkholderiaceae bacterium]